MVGVQTQAVHSYYLHCRCAGAMDAERFENRFRSASPRTAVDHQWRGSWLELGRRRATDRKDHPGRGDVTPSRRGLVSSSASRPSIPPIPAGTSFVSMSDPEMHRNMTSLGHVDAVLPVLHGPYGEMVPVQGLLKWVCRTWGAECLLPPPAWINITPRWCWMRQHSTAPGVTVRAHQLHRRRCFLPRSRTPVLPIRCLSSLRAGSSFSVTKVESR